MNNEIKVSLSCTLPGRIQLSKEASLVNVKVKKFSKKGKPYWANELIENKDFYNLHSLIVTDENRNKERIIFSTLKYKNAKQSLKINKEAYGYMISKQACPEWEKKSRWNTITNTERLESHLNRICKSLGGISYTYEVFED